MENSRDIRQKYINISRGNLNERDNLKDLGLNRKLILKWRVVGRKLD
jgi:hypothetical protein